MSTGTKGFGKTEDVEDAIRQALEGRESGYASLYTHHKDRVFATVSRLTRNSSDTEDLVQITFIKAFEALPRFRRQSAFSTWLTRIALNVSTTHLRSRRSQSEGMERIHRHLVIDGVFLEDMTPDRRLRLQERKHLIEQGLATLPETYRRALSMHYLSERSYTEITRELQVPIGTLKIWLFRARAKLRKEFEMSGLASHVL